MHRWAFRDASSLPEQVVKAGKPRPQIADMLAQSFMAPRPGAFPHPTDNPQANPAATG